MLVSRGRVGRGQTESEGPLIQLGHYDRTIGIDELNLAEFPLASLAARPTPGKNTLIFEDEIFDKGNGRKVRRSLVITGSEPFGLPTAIDNDVLLVLVHLTNVRNQLKAKEVAFSRYELVKFMGWDLGGKSYRRLDESLQRWTSVTLHYKHAWWDRSGKRWQVRSFHVLESLTLRGRDEIGDDGLSSFVWSDVIFDSFQAGNLKRIDLDVYFQLESAAARRMYRFLDKRMFRPKTLQFDLRTFACEHIGFSRAYDVFELKRKLQPAIEELEAIGFLSPLPVSSRYSKLAPGRWQVVLEHAISRKVRTDCAKTSMVGELTQRGVSRSAAESLASSFTAQHIAEKVELHDRLLKCRDKRISKNPPGFLAAAIRNDYRPPEVVKSAECGPRQCQINHRNNSTRQVSHDITSDGNRRKEAARQFWRRLSTSERDELQLRAAAAGEPFQVQTYERLRKAGSRLWEALRDDLVARYLERSGLLEDGKLDRIDDSQ